MRLSALSIAFVVSLPTLLLGATPDVPRIALPVAGRTVTPFPFSVTAGPNGTEWFLVNDAGSGGAFAGTCDGTPAVGITEAQTNSSGDAYDNGYILWAQGSRFSIGTADLTGSTVTAGPVTLSGLSVTRQLYFSLTRQVMRDLTSFFNPTGATINVLVDVPINFGSDGGTVIGATSSGDLNFTIADRWVITSDGAVPSDPVNTTVFAGPNGPGGPFIFVQAVTQTVFDCAATNGVGWSYNVSVPPGITRRLLFFAGLENMLGTGNTVPGAIANAAIFNDTMALHGTTDLTSGLSNAELLEVRNWDFSFLPVELQSFEVQ